MIEWQPQSNYQMGATNDCAGKIVESVWLRSDKCAIGFAIGDESKYRYAATRKRPVISWAGAA